MLQVSEIRSGDVLHIYTMPDDDGKFIAEVLRDGKLITNESYDTPDLPLRQLFQTNIQLGESSFHFITNGTKIVEYVEYPIL